MNFKNPKYIFFAVVTFLIIFLMNYLGNDSDDKLSRALMTAVASVIGLVAGLWIYNKNKNNGSGPDFD